MDLFQLSATLSIDLSTFRDGLSDAKELLDEMTELLKDVPLDDYEHDAQEAGEETKTFGERLRDLLEHGLEKVGDKLQSVGDDMYTFGRDLQRAFEPATKFGKDAIDTFVEYEDAFTGVRKTSEGTEEQFSALDAGIRTLSTTTASSKVEIAGVAETVGQLTDNIEDVLPITETAIKLGDTTVMSAGDAATQLTRLMNIMGDGGEKAGSYGSALVELGNNMATDEKQILNMSLRIAGAGNQIGMTGDQVLALSAGLSSLGIRAEAGGSSISRVLLSMGEAARTGTTEMDELQEKTGMTTRELEMLMENSPSDFRKLADSIGMTNSEMKEIVKGGVHLQEFADISGMTADEFAQAMQEDAYSALLAFLGGLGQLDEEGASAFSVLQGLDLNTIRVRDSLLRGAAGYEEMTKAASMSSEAFEKNTALEDEAALKYGDTASKVHQMKESFSNLTLEVGEKLLPLIERALDFADKVLGFLDTLPDGMLETIATIGLGAGALGNFLSSAGKVATGLGDVLSAVGSFGAGFGKVISSVLTGANHLLGALGPKGVIIGVIIAAVVALVTLIITHWDEIKEVLIKAGDWISDKIEKVGAWFTNIQNSVTAGLDAVKNAIFTAWDAIVGFWEGVGAGIENALTSIGDWFSRVGQTISDGLAPIGQFFSDAWGAAKTAVQKQLDDMVTAYESHDNKVEGILAAGWELMTSGWDAAWTFVNELTNGKLEEIAGAIGDWVSARLEAIGKFFSNMQEKVKSGLEAVKNFFTNGFETIKQTITTFVTQAITKITEFVQNVKNKIEEFKNNLIEKFEKLKSDVVAKVTKIKDDAVEGFRTLVETVRTKISEFPGIVIGKIEEVTSFISGLPGKMLNWGRDMIQSFVNGITQTWESIKSNVVGIADWVAGIFGHSHPDFGPMADDYKWMPDMMKSFARGIRDNRDLVLGEMQGLANDMAGTMGFSYGPAYTAPRTAPMTTGNGMNGSAAQNDRPINITVQSVLDGRVIGETAYRYNRQRNYVLGRANA